MKIYYVEALENYTGHRYKYFHSSKRSANNEKKLLEKEKCPNVEGRDRYQVFDVFKFEFKNTKRGIIETFDKLFGSS
jgi:hypothetical protein